MKYKLEELCEFITDGTHQTPEYCEDGGVKFLSSKDVTARKIDWDNVKYIPESLHEKLYARLSPRKNDILLAKNGTTGVAALVDRDEIFDVYVSLAVLRPKDIVYPKYLLYAINSPVAKRQFDAGLKGVGVPNLHLSVIRKTEINIEEYEKQLEVCGILDKVASIIDARKEELQKLDDLIKARFVELFGDLMLNPHEWSVMKISDVSLLLKSGLSRKLSDDDIGLPVIRSGNIQNGQFIYDDVKYWYKDDPQGSKTADYILEDGDILVNFINSASQIGKTAIFRDVGRDCIYTTNIFRMKLAGNCNEYYYNWFAMSDYYYRQLQNIIQPAVNQASFTTVNFLKLNVPLPPMELQEQFANFVKQTDKSKFIKIVIRSLFVEKHY